MSLSATASVSPTLTSWLTVSKFAAQQATQAPQQFLTQLQRHTPMANSSPPLAVPSKFLTAVTV
jgi:hypothetical protein